MLKSNYSTEDVPSPPLNIHGCPAKQQFSTPIRKQIDRFTNFQISNEFSLGVLRFLQMVQHLLTNMDQSINSCRNNQIKNIKWFDSI